MPTKAELEAENAALKAQLAASPSAPVERVQGPKGESLTSQDIGRGAKATLFNDARAGYSVVIDRADGSWDWRKVNGLSAGRAVMGRISGGQFAEGD